MGAQMPENPEKPMDGRGPIEPAKPITGPSEEGGEIAPQALPVAAKELAANDNDVAADSAVAVPASVPAAASTPIVVPTERSAKKPLATLRLHQQHPLALR